MGHNNVVAETRPTAYTRSILESDMAFLNFLRVGSRGHVVHPGQGGAFDMFPLDDTQEALIAFQAVAREAISNGGAGYRVEERATQGRSLPGMRTVYDSLGIFPTAVS